MDIDVDQDTHELDPRHGAHPFGVQPWGNFWMSGASAGGQGAKAKGPSASRSCRDTGLGPSMARLDDLVVLEVLGCLSASDLGTIASVSRGLYVFAHHDELWKPLVIGRFRGAFKFSAVGGWKQTYLDAASAAAEAGSDDSSHGDAAARSPRISPIRVDGFYSDVLFQPYFAASRAIDARWLEVSNVDRRSNLSREDFIRDYEAPNKPVIITDAVTKWPAFGKWSKQSLQERFGDTMFTAGPVDMTLRDYYQYAERQNDDRPTYLFDKHFARRASPLAAEYSVPEYFDEDLFSVLGEEMRPAYRWLICGPERSGSSFHVDPNGTSAWNAVVEGAKKWVFFPPNCVPPGVFPSTDGAQVATPVSLTEWFMDHYEDARRGVMPTGEPELARPGGSRGAAGAGAGAGSGTAGAVSGTDGTGVVRPLECVTRAGEVIFVPSGWWHAVVNLEDSIAITQNYVSRRNLLKVLRFLDARGDQVSGCADGAGLHDRFVEALEKAYPGELAALRDAEAKATAAAAAPKTKFAQTMAAAGSDGGSTFKFSFGR